MTIRSASWLPTFAVLSLAAPLMLGVAACDGGASAVKAPKAGDVATAAEPASDRDAPSYSGGAYDSAATRRDPRDAPVPKVAGKPMWAANRTRTAEENAQRGFERYGAEFAAADVDDYVRKTHAFVARPPAGAQTLTRANGDTLIYDPKDNVFAVVTKAGAPRTMFKPDDGATYWATQKAGQGRRTTASRDRAPSSDG
jgi:pyocin large subunit-like protein